MKKEPMLQAPLLNKDVQRAAPQYTAVQLIAQLGATGGGRTRLLLIQMILLTHCQAGFEKMEPTLLAPWSSSNNLGGEALVCRV